MTIRSLPFGDGAVRLELPGAIDPAAALEALLRVRGVQDVVITERHACVSFDPERPVPELGGALLQVLEGRPPEERRLEIVRVRYDGPDLPRLAEGAGISVEEVIRLHAERCYQVRMVGFLPGFAYLGEVAAAIALPRLPAPRQRVPAGAVGIAGERTGIYPFASPGGWNLVGTAVDFVPFDQTAGAILRLGDRVRFVRV